MRTLVALSLLFLPAMAQTNVQGQKYIATVDATSATSTKPNQTGVLASRPANCGAGQTYFATNATAGQNLSLCTTPGSPGTWTTVSGSGTVTNVAPLTADQIVVGSGSNAVKISKITVDAVTSNIGTPGSVSTGVGGSASGELDQTGVTSLNTVAIKADDDTPAATVNNSRVSGRMAVRNNTFVNGNCVKGVGTDGLMVLTDAGAPCGSGGGGGVAGSTLFSATSSVTVTATTPTTLIGTVIGSTTVPATTFTAGQFLQFVAQGFYSTPATATSLTIDLKISGTTRISTGAIVTLPSVTNGTWRLICGVTTRTTGASGTQIANCIFETTGATLTPGEAPLQTSSTWTIDTTVTNAIDLQATWSTVIGAPTITATNVVAYISGGAVWGGITGTLGNQSDLQTDLFGAAVPPSASWSWINQGSSTNASNSAGGFSLKIPDNASLNWRWYSRTETVGSDFTWTAFFYPTTFTANTQLAGIYLINTGASNKTVGWEILSQSSVYVARVEHILNTTTDGATVSTTGALKRDALIGLRIQRISGNCNFSYSTSLGLSWVAQFSESCTTYTTPNAVGIGGVSVTSNAALYTNQDVVGYSFTNP